MNSSMSVGELRKMLESYTDDDIVRLSAEDDYLDLTIGKYKPIKIGNYEAFQFCGDTKFIVNYRN